MRGSFVFDAAVVFAFLITAAPAARGEDRSNQGKSNVSAGQSKVESLSAGSMFAGRFQLVARLQRQDFTMQPKRNGKHHSGTHHDVKDPMPLPHEVAQRFDEPEYIHAGTFGEVWKARDIQNDNRPVALKMFFEKDGRDDSKHRPLTWARAQDDSRLRRRVNYASMECKMANSLQQFSQQDPVAASRLMRCYEDHTDPAKIGDEAPIYQVLEYCGSRDLTQWIRDHQNFAESSPKEYVVSALLVFTQLVHVLSYLTRFDEGYCHHDLKPENIMIKEGADGKDYIKLIDFGSMSKISNENAKKRAVSSPAYAEPDWFNDVGDFLIHNGHWLRGYNAENPASFDIYAASTILDEMITGTSTYTKWKIMARSEPQPDYLDEMCRRQRLFTRLSEYPNNYVSVSKALQKVTDQYEKKEVQLCRKWLRILHVKGDSGIEPRFTKIWGQGGTSWPEKSKALEPDLEQLLHCEECVNDHFTGAVDEYKRLIQPYDWNPTFMRMMAVDPLVRPEPSEVMKTPLLRKLGTLSPLEPVPTHLFDNDDKELPSLIEEGAENFVDTGAFDEAIDIVEYGRDSNDGDDAIYVLHVDQIFNRSRAVPLSTGRNTLPKRRQLPVLLTAQGNVRSARGSSHRT